ncbi:MAG: AAA family ATPase [Clostridia bacterium]|nr:AAA family ATPase [Clostridia bacterium]
MGEYLTLLCQVREMIYAKDIAGATAGLKRLLNCLNADLSSTKSVAEKQKSKSAIIKLLPALNDLKAGLVSETVITLLGLDRAILFPPKKTETPKVDDFDFSSFGTTTGGKVEPPVKKEPPKTEPPKLKPPQKLGRENTLAPLTFDDYIGQAKAKAKLKISIAAAKMEQRALAHTMICSSYGLGKTTLANIVANEMGMPFFTANATQLKDVKSLSLYFTKIEEPCLIFIDEIHTLKKDVQTVLLSILTDFQVNFIDEVGDEKIYKLPQFTLIGATTQAGELLKPFLNRFDIIDLVDYTEEEKAIIVRAKFEKLGLQIDEEAVKDVSARSRGVPRTIEIYAKGIKDHAQVMYKTTQITKAICTEYFDLIEIDAYGLGNQDRNILRCLREVARPIGLLTMESKVGLQREEIAFRYEPYMIKLGLLEKTEKGRIITKKGIEYLDKYDNGGGDDLIGDDDVTKGDDVEFDLTQFGDITIDDEVKTDDTVTTDTETPVVETTGGTDFFDDLDLTGFDLDGDGEEPKED